MKCFHCFPIYLTYSWHNINSYCTWCINTSVWFFFKSISIICSCWILTLCQAGHCWEPRGKVILMFLLTHIVKFSPQRLTFNRIYSEKTIAKNNNLSYEKFNTFNTSPHTHTQCHWYVASLGQPSWLPSSMRMIKVNLYDCAGVKMNINQVGFIIIFMMMFIFFFLL